VRYLLLSDLHSNDEALAAVLARVRRKRWDCLIVLGDLVGYGANPNHVVERLRRVRKRKVLVRGNHDRVAAGLDTGDLFNPVALHAARWTAGKLTEPVRAFLGALPAGPLEVDGEFLICHGSPRDEDAYIFSDRDAYWNFLAFEHTICFFGHSHIPSIFTLDPAGIGVEAIRSDGAVRRLEPGRRYLINPGSVGQPRDRNRAASYAIYDSKRAVVHFDRVAYDVEKARAKIIRAGLPGMLGDRLLVGA
jgi:predicted phosphodiesterase